MTKRETAIFLYKKQEGQIKASGEEALDPEVAYLWNAFSYEFEYWTANCGFVPVSLVASGDRSENYELDAFFVFELVRGYATVWECGRSDYYPAEADIDFVHNLETALKAFNKWKKRRE